MYNVLTVQIPAAGTSTPIVTVPGRLLGVAGSFDVSAVPRISVITGDGQIGTAPIVSEPAIAALTGSFFIDLLGELPVGNMQYVVTASVAQTAARNVQFYFDTTNYM